MDKKNLPLPLITKRVELMLGHRCNASCRFCYFLNSVTRGCSTYDISTETAKSILGIIRKQGLTEVEFTGGEPTVREDLPELAACARDMGFVNISLITNGLKLGNRDYAERLIASGVNDVIFSVHGHTGELHDHQTRTPGSFHKIMYAVANVARMGARCRSNTVINGINFRHAGEILGHLIDLKMEAIYFVLFNPITEAHNAESHVFVNYKDAAEYIMRGIDTYRTELPCFSVKYIPFCYLKGYEPYVMNCPQQNYDPDEWNIYVSYKLSLLNLGFFRRNLALSMAMFRGFRRLKGYWFPLKHGWQGLKTRAVTQYVETLGKVCLEKCRICRYYNVCDFIWDTYYQMFGDDGIEPVRGPRIKNPVWCHLGSTHRRPGAPVAGTEGARGHGLS